MLTDSKDSIKSRMIRNASVLWGFQDTQDINSFDPIVGMILGALAEEIYNVSEEIKKTDSRIIEKLLELLTSQSVFASFPAYALARAKPTQSRVNISELYQFSYEKKISVTQNEETVFNSKTIFFTPTSEIRLFKGEIKYLAGGNTLFEISDQVKEPLTVFDRGTMPDYSKIFIGLRMDTLIDSIDGLSLLFSIKNKQTEERFYNLISNSAFKLNNKVLELYQGFGKYKSDKTYGLNDIIRKENDISDNACRYVNEFYKNKFMTVEDHGYVLRDFYSKESMPDELKSRIPSNILKTIQPDVFWIEIQLSQLLEPEIINDLTVMMNCFPVVNRQINEVSQLVTKGTNVIPMASDDLYFDIKSVLDTRGTNYNSVNSFSAENADEDIYMVRQGGVARFDSRDAKETINHLIDLIRDERASFALLGTELISSELKQLDQIITRLKQRLDSSNISDSSNAYVLVNCGSKYERATVQYWTTSGEMANNIRPNSRLLVHQGPDIDYNSVILVTGTSGGRQKLSKEDKLNRLRRMLLSKGRVVTKEDIKALCFEHFGVLLENVEIKRGAHLDPSQGKGPVRSLDIYLIMSRQNKLTENEVGQKIDELKIRLSMESLNLLPFRIFIK